MAKSKKNNLNSFEGIFFGENNVTSEAVKDTVITEVTETTIPRQANYPKEVVKEEKTITPKIISPVKTKQTKVSKGTEKIKETRKRGRPKSNRETKQRITFTLLKSNYDEASKVAYIEGKSVSQVVGDFLYDYVNQNQDKISEYNNLTEN